MASPVGDVNEREAADEQLELVRREDAEQRERHDVVHAENELSELVGDALHHHVAQAQLKVLVDVLRAHLDLAAARLELHRARDAELFDGNGKVEAEVLELVGVEGAHFVQRAGELPVDVVQVAVLNRPREQHLVSLQRWQPRARVEGGGARGERKWAEASR